MSEMVLRLLMFFGFVGMAISTMLLIRLFKRYIALLENELEKKDVFYEELHEEHLNTLSDFRAIEAQLEITKKALKTAQNATSFYLQTTQRS